MKGIKVIYRAGYLIPVEPVKGKFNIQREKALVAKGTHFFCWACLGAVVIEEQSKNKKYCKDCYEVMKE